MNFDFSDDQRLLQTASRDFLEDKSPLSVARDVLESDASMSHELWQGAAEMGWHGAALPEQYGGAGFGYLELALVSEEVGRALAPIPFGSSVCASESIVSLGNDEQKSRLLPEFADGTRIGTLALAERAGVVKPEHIETTYQNGTVSGCKIAVSDGNSANTAIVAARDGDGICLTLVDLGSQGVARDAIDSIDPTRSVANITFENAPAELLADGAHGWSKLQDVIDRGAVLQAFEQVGSADRALEITKEQILSRYAFGRPIASFQAIKHRMADTWAAIELARSNCYFGAWALANAAPELAVAACSARISASDALVRASEEMIQMHGGVGFTWEYDCHMFYRRAQALSLGLGAQAEWRDKLIDRLSSQAA